MIQIVSFRYPHFHENTYLVFDETKNCILVDPGCYTIEEKEQIHYYIKSHQLKLNKIVNTHCHIDHVFGNRYFMDEFDVPLLLHEKELRFLEVMPSFGKKMGYEIQPVIGTIKFIEGGETIEFGNTTFDILDTPGHTTGSISLINNEEKVLISGDVIFNNAIGKTSLPGGNYDILLNTIEEIIFTLNEDIIVYPGHGPTTNIGYLKKYNKLYEVI